MWHTVIGGWVHEQPLYLPNENTLPTRPTHTTFINEWLTLAWASKKMEVGFRLCTIEI